MTEKWEVKRNAFRCFELLRNWNSEQETLACQLSSMREYKSYQTIYYEDKGMLDPVFFVISGQCMILQCLKVKVKIMNGKKSYQLCPPDTLTEKQASMFQRKASTQVNVTIAATNATAATSTTPTCALAVEQPDSAFSLENLLEAKNRRDRRKSSLRIKTPVVLHVLSAIQEMSKISRELKNNQFEAAIPEIFITEEEEEVKNEIKEDIKVKIEESASIEPEEKCEEIIEVHFIDIGTMNSGAIFGLGEDMEQRAVVAKSTVHCIAIPRYWLFEKKQNPGNVWQRMRFYLNTTVPSRDRLFKHFLAERNWRNYRKSLVKSICSKIELNNPTKIGDVPKICRIVESM